MTSDAVEANNNGAKQAPPPDPKEAIQTLLASLEHHGQPESWPDGFYEQAQLAALYQDEAADEDDEEEVVEAAREAAREKYGSDDVDFDATPEVSLGDDGAYVRAWLFVPRDSLPGWRVEDADAESTPPPDGGFDAA